MIKFLPARRKCFQVCCVYRFRHVRTGQNRALLTRFGASANPDRILKGSDVEPLAHFLARLEIRDALGRDFHRIAGAGIAALAGVAIAGGKGAEAAKLDAAALLQLVDDGIEDSGDDALNLLDGEIGMVLAEFLHEFGTDQGFIPNN